MLGNVYLSWFGWLFESLILFCVCYKHSNKLCFLWLPLPAISRCLIQCRFFACCWHPSSFACCSDFAWYAFGTAPQSQSLSSHIQKFHIWPSWDMGRPLHLVCPDAAGGVLAMHTSQKVPGLLCIATTFALARHWTSFLWRFVLPLSSPFWELRLLPNHPRQSLFLQQRSLHLLLGVCYWYYPPCLPVPAAWPIAGLLQFLIFSKSNHLKWSYARVLKCVIQVGCFRYNHSSIYCPSKIALAVCPPSVLSRISPDSSRIGRFR